MANTRSAKQRKMEESRGIHRDEMGRIVLTDEQLDEEIAHIERKLADIPVRKKNLTARLKELEELKAEREEE